MTWGEIMREGVICQFGVMWPGKVGMFLIVGHTSNIEVALDITTNGVGLRRIELRTSALSVLRSNRLSYSPEDPIDRNRDFGGVGSSIWNLLLVLRLIASQSSLLPSHRFRFLGIQPMLHHSL